MGYRVAVVGATGNVGREMLNILAERAIPSRRDRRPRLGPLDRRHHRLWRFRPRAEGPQHRAFRFRRLGHGLVRRRLGRVEGLCAEGRVAAGCTVIDNALLFPDGPGRAADRARGEPGGDRSLSPQEHHRQPELLDRADGRGAEAAPRCREDQAGRGRDLSIGLGRGQGRHGRIVRAEPQHLRRRRRTSR